MPVVLLDALLRPHVLYTASLSSITTRTVWLTKNAPETQRHVESVARIALDPMDAGRRTDRVMSVEHRRCVAARHQMKCASETPSVR